LPNFASQIAFAARLALVSFPFPPGRSRLHLFPSCAKRNGEDPQARSPLLAMTGAP
jgi:hypothetical protein